MLKGIRISGMQLTAHEIPNTLQALQKVVGGYIEIAKVGDNLIAVCNEEGMLEGLPINMLGFAGDIFICRSNLENGEMESLTPEEQTSIMNQLRGRYIRDQAEKMDAITKKFLERD